MTDKGNTPSRRAFLMAAATSASLIAPKAVFAQEAAAPAPAPADTPLLQVPDTPGADDLNVAIIGLGSQGMILLDALLRIPGIHIRAICDIWEYSRKRGAGVARKFGHDPAVYEDYQELLRSHNNLQAVIIATPDFLHAEQAITCMEAGLHVYCETPMSHRLALARRMATASHRTGRRLQIGQQRRSNPRYIHAIRELIHRRQILGRITNASAHWNRGWAGDLAWPKKYEIPKDILQRYGYDSMSRFRNWRWYRQYSQGPFLELASNQLDVIDWALEARPVSVYAGGGISTGNGGHECYDNVFCIIEYATPRGPCRVTYEMRSTNGFGQYFENVFGDEGTLQIAEVAPLGDYFAPEECRAPDWQPYCEQNLLGARHTVFHSVSKDEIAEIRESLIPHTHSYPIPVTLHCAPQRPHLENFFDAIRTGVPLNCPAAVGYRTAVIVQKCLAAAKRRRRLDFTERDFAI